MKSLSKASGTRNLSRQAGVLGEDSLDGYPPRRSTCCTTELSSLSLVGDSEHSASSLNLVGDSEHSAHLAVTFHDSISSIGSRGKVYSCVNVQRVLAEELIVPKVLEPSCHVRKIRKLPGKDHFLRGSTHSLTGSMHSFASSRMPSMVGLSKDESCSSFALEGSDEVHPAAPFATQTDSTSEQQQEYMTLEAVISQVQEHREEEEDDHMEEIEVSPGVYLPFRGKRESWQAVAQNRTLQSICMDCGIQLFSVDDCEHVLCPDCTMLNPVFEHPPGTIPSGVGMGLKKEWLDS